MHAYIIFTPQGDGWKDSTLPFNSEDAILVGDYIHLTPIRAEIHETPYVKVIGRVVTQYGEVELYCKKVKNPYPTLLKAAKWTE